jgi:nitrile hydratase
MNGVHDLGGMQGFGPIVPEQNEPVFHAPWEGRVIALRRALAATGKLQPTLRPAIESLPPVDYLRMSYYEIWFAALVEMLVAGGLATHEEIATGRPATDSIEPAAVLTPDQAAVFSFRIPEVILKTAAPPRYSLGQRVRARNMNPIGHTRLPRYVRGRAGLIEASRGVQAFPETSAYGRGENPQHVYSVRFAARELWGEEASARDAVYLDLWEDYLEPA